MSIVFKYLKNSWSWKAKNWNLLSVSRILNAECIISPSIFVASTPVGANNKQFNPLFFNFSIINLIINDFSIPAKPVTKK